MIQERGILKIVKDCEAKDRTRAHCKLRLGSAPQPNVEEPSHFRQFWPREAAPYTIWVSGSMTYVVDVADWPCGPSARAAKGIPAINHISFSVSQFRHYFLRFFQCNISPSFSSSYKSWRNLILWQKKYMYPNPSWAARRCRGRRPPSLPSFHAISLPGSGGTSGKKS